MKSTSSNTNEFMILKTGIVNERKQPENKGNEGQAKNKTKEEKSEEIQDELELESSTSKVSSLTENKPVFIIFFFIIFASFYFTTFFFFF